MNSPAIAGKLVKCLAGGAAIVSVWGVATLANAIPTLTISDGTSLVTVVDGGVGDSAGAAGAVEYVGSLGGWSVVVSSALTKPALGNAADPEMDLLIQAISLTGGNLFVAFSDTDFTGTSELDAALSGHVVAGGAETVGMLVGGNTANLAGTTDATGTLVNFGSLLVDIPVQNMPILATAEGQVPGATPYALTEFVILNSTGPTATSIDASIADSVPDGGATVTLLGTALTGLGILACFIKRSSS